jgi:hypothetical protein
MTKMKKIPGVVAVMLILSITIVHADNHDKAPLSGKPAPEPEAYVFLAIGTLGLVAAYRRRKP